MNSIIEADVCISCKDTNGRQFKCNGCQQSFCWKHTIDHQEQIQKQMGILTQNHDHLKQNWNDYSYYNQLVQRINRWEKESINKIKITADTIRTELKSFLKPSKNNLEISFKQLTEEIEKSKQLNNYSEIEINQWKQQLNDLQSELQISFNIQIKEDQQTLPIYMIKIQKNTKHSLDEHEHEQITIKRSRNELISNDQERFDKVFGDVLIEDDNLVARSRIDSRLFISGSKLYISGKHYLNFKFEQTYRKDFSGFLGLMTSGEDIKIRISQMKSVYAIWSSGDDITSCEELTSNENNKNLILIIDCDNKKVHIENREINWNRTLDINLDLCPFPWRLLTVIRRCKLRIESYVQTKLE